MRKLHLVSDKIFNKKFDTVAIHLADGQMFEFKVEEWDIYRSDDWIELMKKDNSKMECFYVSNVMRVEGYKSTVKPVEPKRTDTLPLKPVA